MSLYSCHGWSPRSRAPCPHGHVHGGRSSARDSRLDARDAGVGGACKAKEPAARGAPVGLAIRPHPLPRGPTRIATQQAVLIADSNLPLKFVAVYEEWRANKARCGAPAKGIYCPQVGGVSCGYKSMCGFWYGGFIKYLNSSYESVLRIDDDCEVDADQPNPMLGLHDVDFCSPTLCHQDGSTCLHGRPVAAFKKFGPSIFGTDASLLVGGKYGEERTGSMHLHVTAGIGPRTAMCFG